MIRFILLGVAVALWLVLWVDNTGVLIESRADPKEPGARFCHYLIGPSVILRVMGDYRRPVDRCPLTITLR